MSLQWHQWQRGTLQVCPKCQGRSLCVILKLKGSVCNDLQGAVLLSLSLVILHQRSPQWQFIIALSLPFSLSLPCGDISILLVRVPANCVAEGPKNNLLPVRLGGFLMRLPASYLIHLSLLFLCGSICCLQTPIFFLKLCHSSLAVSKPDLTLKIDVLMLKITTENAWLIWL